MPMNTAKVVTGGLLAGLVFNIGDFVINTFIVAEENRQLMTRLGLNPAALESFSGVLPFIVVDFLFGILVVWTYAAIRPRFGPGVQTAVRAGLIPLIAVTLVMAAFTSVGMFPTGMFLKNTVGSIVNVLVGSIAGAWAYTES